MKIAYREAFQSLDANPCPRRTVIPPNRLESRNWDLLAALTPAKNGDGVAALHHAMQQWLGCEQIHFEPSARCAIAHILALLPQSEVVMPAFNCDVVKSAVEAAGKRIIYVDVAAGGVNATAAEFAAEAKPGRVLLVTHQFGVPTDVEEICALAKKRDCVTIEDAACCFGAMRNGRRLGTFADYGVFSFESWKRLSAFRGGVIAINQGKGFDPARLATEPLVKTTLKLPVRELVRALARNVATIPWLYGRGVLPLLLRGYLQPSTDAGGANGSDVTRYAPYTAGFHPYQARLVLRMLKRFDAIRRHIAELVAVYDQAFPRGGEINALLPVERDDAGLLRFPIVFPGRERADVLRRALKRGLYLETEFEQPLPAPSELWRFPHAAWLARNLILLPLYTALPVKRARWLADQLHGIARDHSA